MSLGAVGPEKGEGPEGPRSRLQVRSPADSVGGSWVALEPAATARPASSVRWAEQPPLAPLDFHLLAPVRSRTSSRSVERPVQTS